jgi:hypothetical protein
MAASGSTTVGKRKTRDAGETEPTTSSRYVMCMCMCIMSYVVCRMSYVVCRMSY